MIQVIIIDDEPKSISTVKEMLTGFCDDVTVVGIAENVKDAIDIIDRMMPDLVFLDISLPDGDGFDILEKVHYKNFDVIFITASEKHAVKAFDFAAIHYLLKPVNLTELQLALDRFRNKSQKTILKEQLSIMKESLHKKPDKIIFSGHDGLIIKNLTSIIRFEADDNYTVVYTLENERIVVSKTLSVFERLLADNDFFCRVHNKHIVNLQFLKKYIKGKGGYLILNNDHSIDVSESRKNDFLNKLSILAVSF